VRVIIVITGGIGTGKSTLAARLSEMARERGFTVGGVIAHRRADAKSRAVEYWTECLLGGDERLFATTRRRKDACRFGRFYFPRTAISFASRCLRRSAACDYIFIDELGPLELSGGGLLRATRFLLENSRACLIVVIRRGVLNDMLSLLRIQPDILLDTEIVRAESCESAAQEIFSMRHT
jgi:nucleoside-triphosphatase THEP1